MTDPSPIRHPVLRYSGRAGLTLVAVLAVLWYLGPPRIQSCPYAQNVTATSAVIGRIDAEPTRVRLRLSPDPGPDGTVTETAPITHHELRVRGLSPSTRYRYVVEDLEESNGVVRSDEGEFVTAPSGDDDATVRFVAVGDTGKVPGWWRELQRFGLTRLRPLLAPIGGVYPQWDVARGIAAVRPDFMVHLGDVVYPRGERSFYEEAFFLPLEPVLRGTTSFMVLGNHDTTTDDGAPFYEMFDLPRSLSGGERYYTFAWGAVRVIVLDTNERQPTSPGSPMVTWLAETLASVEEPWLVVAMHHPIFCSSRYADNERLKADIWPLLVEHHVDLMLAGHSHNYMRFRETDGVTPVISGGGGHSLYEVLPDERLVAQAEEYGFLTVEVKGPTLTADWIDRHGKTLDHFVLDHRSDTGVPLDSPRGRRIRALN